MECFECGDIATENHHVIPKILGGTKTIPLCSPCHSKVHGFGKRRDNIKRLTKEGLAKKKERGERTGQIPFGFELDEDGIHLRENEYEQEIISIVLSLRESGLTYKKIAKELEKRGLKSKANKIKWGATQIRNIIVKQAA